ncbi:hydrolase [Sporolactobacillus inulinus]|uniref:Hydrolase n=1 Tax=Sporolactobacillus inulinus TaxID=2078 RepID=A0A4Y1Z6H3_9BACL|nr:hydrolase [Sporolactobacillus inulinus]
MTFTIVVIISIALLISVVCLFVGYYIRKNIAEAKITSAETAAHQIVEDAHRDAESLKKEALLEAKDEIHTLRNQTENEARDRRNELQRLENRLVQKEDLLDRKK